MTEWFMFVNKRKISCVVKYTFRNYKISNKKFYVSCRGREISVLFWLKFKFQFNFYFPFFLSLLLNRWPWWMQVTLCDFFSSFLLCALRANVVHSTLQEKEVDFAMSLIRQWRLLLVMWDGSYCIFQKRICRNLFRKSVLRSLLIELHGFHSSM